jgi:protein-disulfide isomerase
MTMRSPRSWFDPYMAIGFLSVLAIGGSLVWQRSARAPTDLPQLPSALLPALDSAGVGHGFGDPAAPVMVATLSDYACEGCAVADERHHARLREMVESGLVRYTIYDTPIPSHRNAPAAAAVAACVYDHEPALYLAVRRNLFTRQADWIEEADPADALSRIAVDAGVKSPRLLECLTETGAERQKRARLGWSVARNAGATYVPLWIVNGKTINWLRLEEEVQRASASRR